MQPSSDGRAGGSPFDRFRNQAVLLTLLALLMAGLARLCFFVVGADEHAVVTQFGNPVQVVTAPGLGFKYPYQSVNRFDRRLFVYTPPVSEFLTLEKTAVVASGAILWRIAEPKRFFETVFDRMGAESRLGDILSAELGAAIGRNMLATFVSVEPDADHTDALLEQVAGKCREIALRDYGIEVVDVHLQRFDFPERNRLRVYARMKSERAGISMKARAEGEEEGLKIRAAADEEKARILAEAFKVSERHRGAGEAEAAGIYAEALGEAPEFYRFLRSMEASRKFIRKDTTLVLPAGAELFRLLQDSRHYHRDPTSLAGRPEEGAQR